MHIVGRTIHGEKIITFEWETGHSVSLTIPKSEQPCDVVARLLKLADRASVLGGCSTSSSGYR